MNKKLAMNKNLKIELDNIYNNFVNEWKSLRNKNTQSGIVKGNNKSIFNELKKSLRTELVRKGFEYDKLTDSEKLDKESYIHCLLSEFISLHNQLE